jgi:hypothetical protein
MAFKSLIMMICVLGFYLGGFLFLVNRAFNSENQ